VPRPVYSTWYDPKPKFVAIIPIKEKKHTITNIGIKIIVNFPPLWLAINAREKREITHPREK